MSPFGCSARPSRAPIEYQTVEWRFGDQPGEKITTAHYQIYTTVRDTGLTRTFPELVERTFAYYRQLVPPAREPAEPLPVYLFATRGQWARYTRQHTGHRAATFLKVRNGGYSEGGVSIIQYVSNPITFPLLAHEGLHQYLHHCVSPNVPAWLNEGLAVICEGQVWSDSGLRQFDPWYNPVRRNQLAEAVLRNRLFPLREILGTHAGNVIDETSARVATYYAQVWALQLFLREGAGGRYAAGLDELLRELGAPDLDRRVQAESIWAERGRISRGEAIFRRFITDDLDGFEREYREFLRERILDSAAFGGQARTKARKYAGK